MATGPSGCSHTFEITTFRNYYRGTIKKCHMKPRSSHRPGQWSYVVTRTGEVEENGDVKGKKKPRKKRGIGKSRRGVRLFNCHRS